MKTWHQYLLDLTNPVRVLTLRQALDHYFQGSQEKMRRVLRAHEAAGLITLSTELVRGRHTVSGPIAIIKAGELPPSAEQIAYTGRQRWSENIAPTVIIRGTAKLAMVLGGKVHTVVAANLSHEVALTDLFLHKRKTVGPEFHWSLVNAKPGAGSVADAVTASGCIELIGRYNGATVSAKLTLAGSTNLELW
jgi:hypothetical protein